MNKLLKKRFLLSLCSILFFSSCDSIVQTPITPFDPVLKPPLPGNMSGMKNVVEMTDRLGNTSMRTADCLYDVRNGCTYKLLDDIHLENNIIVFERYTATIDLNGYVLSGTGSGSVITNHGTLIIKDSTPSRTNNVSVNKMDASFNGNLFFNTASMSGGVITGGHADAGSHGGGGIYNTGSLFIYGGNISGNTSETYGGGIRNNGGNINFNGGNIEGNNSPYGGGIANYDEASIASGQSYDLLNNTVGTGGTTGGSSSSTISSRPRSVVVINGGTIRNNSGDIGGGIFTKGENTAVTITSGVIENNASSGSQSTEAVYAESPVNITGGVIEGKINITEDAKIVVRGGEFTEEISDEWLPEGATYDATSGTVSDPNLVEGTAEVEVIDETGSVTISDESALFDIKDGYVYKLMGNISLSQNIHVPSGITAVIDLNGFILKGSGAPYKVSDSQTLTTTAVIYTSGNLTITDSNPMASHYYTLAANDLLEWDEENGTFPLAGGAITGGYLTDNASGSGIYNYGGTLTLERGNIVGNSGSNGGGIYTVGGTVKIYGGSISGNAAESGAGVYISRGNLIMEDGVLSYNTAVNGGAISNDGGNLTLEGGNFYENIATSYGGGIFNTGTFNFNAGSFTQNQAERQGGAIYNKGRMFVTGGEIFNNKISKYSNQTRGTGIMNTSNGELTLENCTIGDNSITNPPFSVDYTPAGNVCSAGKLTINKGTVIGGKVTNSLHIEGGTTRMYDGGITYFIDAAVEADVILYGGYFTKEPPFYILGIGSQLTKNDGSNINYPAKEYAYVLSSSFVEVINSAGNASTETVDVLTTLSNRLTYKLLGNVSLSENMFVPEGVIATLDLNGFVLKGTGKASVITNRGNLTIIDSSVFATHKFVQDESGYYRLDEKEGTISLTGGVITGGDAIIGGGILNYGNLTIKAGNIAGNRSYDYGGGIGNNGTLFVVGGSVVGNVADEGAGISNFGNMQMAGGNVSSNGALQNGGGVANFAKFTMNGGTVSKNTAANGSGIYTDTELNILGGEIKLNTATANGGGISVLDGTVTISGGKVYDNTAHTGGGLLIQSGSAFNMDGGIIGRNTSTSGGYVIHCNGGSVTIKNGGIIGDIKRVSGTVNIIGGYFANEPNAAFIVDGSDYMLNTGDDANYPRTDFKYAVVNKELIISQPQVEVIQGSGSSTLVLAEIVFDAPLDTSNTTYKLLDNVDLTKTIKIPAGARNVTLDLNGHVICGSFADGCAISVEDAGELILTDSNPTMPHKYNYDGVTGGYILQDETGSISISGGSVIDSSGSNAGAIYNAGSLTIKGGSFMGNKATSDKGGVFYNSGTLTINKVLLMGNSGNAIYNVAGTTNITNGGIVGQIRYGEGRIHITGGYFDFEPNWSFIADGYSISNNFDYAGEYPPSTFAYTIINTSVLTNKVEITDNTGKTMVSTLGTFKDRYIYKLLGDYELSSTISVPENVYATLDLNGFILSASGDFHMIDNKGTLNLIDTNNLVTHKYSAKSDTDPYVLDETNGTVEIKGGALLGGKGSAIKNTGIFNMRAGAVVGFNSWSIVQNFGTFNLENGYITGNKFTLSSGQTTGGVVWNEAAGTFNMRGGFISNNSSNYFGGGVYNLGDFVFFDGFISNNISSQNGGGVYNRGTFTIIGGNIYNNKADQGGGIFNENSTNISGGSFNGNVASKGSDIASTASRVDISGGYFSGDFYETVSGGFKINGGYFKIEPSEAYLKEDYIFIENSGGNINAPADVYKWTTYKIPVSSDGNKTIYVYDHEVLQSVRNDHTYVLKNDIILKKTITITEDKDVTIDLNGHTLTGDVSGSLINNAGELFIMSNPKNNTTKKTFETLYTYVQLVDESNNKYEVQEESVTLSCSEGVITGGKGTTGGAICNTGSLKLDQVFLVNNTATKGGAIYNGPGSSFNMLVGCNIQGNTADEGGAIYFDNPKSAKIEGGKIRYNKANYGGAIYYKPNGGELSTVEINGMISDNTAMTDGGAIFLAEDGDSSSGNGINYPLVISKGSFTQNSALGCGGAFYFSESVLFSNATIWDDNYNMANNTDDSKGNAFHITANNLKIRIDGGAYACPFPTTAPFEIRGGFFASPPEPHHIHPSYRRSSTPAGGEYSAATYPYTVTLAPTTTSVISVAGEEDLADLTIGSTYRLTQDITLSKPLVVPSHVDTTIDLNGYTLRLSDDSDTAGVILNSGNLNLVSTATDKGVITGGSGFNSAALTRSEFGLTDGNPITFDSEPIQGGGGIYNIKNLSVKNVEISGNKAESGGGILNFGDLTVENSVISGNSASRIGGGIANGYIGKLTMRDSVIINNNINNTSATVQWWNGGGGAYIGQYSSAVFENVEMDGNKCTEPRIRGAAIYCLGELTVNNSEIKNVTEGNAPVAVAYGGALSVKDSGIECQTANFTNDTATFIDIEQSTSHYTLVNSYINQELFGMNNTNANIMRTMGKVIDNPGDNDRFPVSRYKYKVVEKPVVEVNSPADFENIASDKIYRLMQNIKLEKTLEISLQSVLDDPNAPMENIILDLNGYVLQGSGKPDQPVISLSMVRSGGWAVEFAIVDSNPTKSNWYTVESSGLYKWSENGGTVELKGGAITGGFGTDGGGISIGSDIGIYILGGNIVGNSATNGGGICALSTYGDASLYFGDGARIVGNVATSAGNAIYSYKTVFNVTDCEIYGNSGSSSDVHTGAKFRIYGGGFKTTKFTGSAIEIRGGFFTENVKSTWLKDRAKNYNSSMVRPKYTDSDYSVAVLWAGLMQ